jgi:hypothetical protein
MTKYTISLIITALLFSGYSHGQATNPSNIGVNSDYLGWNALVPPNTPLNFNIYNQNNYIFSPGVQTFPVTLAPLTFVLGQGSGALSQERIFVRLTQMQGNTRIGLYADMIDPNNGNSAPVFAGRYTVKADGFSNRAVESIVFNTSSPGGTKIGIRAQLCKAKGYAIFATAYSIDPQSTNWAGWFDGDVYHSGTWLPPSDSTLKYNIAGIENALGLISNFEPKQYEFRVEDYQTLHLPQGQHYGFIAQDVETFLPELVSLGSSATKYDEEGGVEFEPVEFRGLSYFSVIPIIVGALSERQAIIDQQTAAIADLEAAIAQLEAQLEE